MRKRQSSQEFFDLLASGRWIDFTVSELKYAYQALPNRAHLSDKAAWQFVYRQISRLEKRGLVSRLANQKGERARYRLNDQVTPTGVSATVERSGQESIEIDSAIRLALKEKLHRYKVEMLSAIGETEEYDAICAELPDMRDSVQKMYNEARDRCSKMLGRVKALESILAQQLDLQRTS